MNPANGRERKRGGMRISLALMPPESEVRTTAAEKRLSGIARRVSQGLRSPAEAAHTSAPAAGPHHRRSSTPNAPAASPAAPPKPWTRQPPGAGLPFARAGRRAPERESHCQCGPRECS